MDNVPKKEKDPYAFSQKMYVIECALDYLITIITSGAYLAKLTTTIGISDALTAILSNLTSLAGVFQLISIRLSHRANLKRSVVPLKTGYHLIYSLIYLIPFFNLGTGVNSALFFICILTACALNQICAPLKYSWFMALPSPERRGSFTSIVNIFSHISGLVFSFIASMLLDHFTKTGNNDGMFITFTSVIFILAALHFITLIVSKEKPRKIAAQSSLVKDFKALIKNRRFVLYIFVYMTYCMGVYATSSFLGTYQVRELGFSMMQIYLLSVVMAVSAIIFLSFFGNFARKKGLTRSLLFGYPIYALAYLLITFSTPENGFIMLMLYQIIATFGSAGVTVSIEPIIFEIVPEEYRTSALSIRNIPSGLMAFVTTLLLTPLLNYIQGNGNTLFGFHIYAQQLFAVISILLFITSITLFLIFSRTHSPKKEYGEEIKDSF